MVELKEKKLKKKKESRSKKEKKNSKHQSLEDDTLSPLSTPPPTDYIKHPPSSSLPPPPPTTDPLLPKPFFSPPSFGPSFDPPALPSSSPPLSASSSSSSFSSSPVPSKGLPKPLTRSGGHSPPLAEVVRESKEERETEREKEKGKKKGGKEKEKKRKGSGVGGRFSRALPSSQVALESPSERSMGRRRSACESSISSPKKFSPLRSSSGRRASHIDSVSSLSQSQSLSLSPAPTSSPAPSVDNIRARSQSTSSSSITNLSQSCSFSTSSTPPPPNTAPYGSLSQSQNISIPPPLEIQRHRTTTPPPTTTASSPPPPAFCSSPPPPSSVHPLTSSPPPYEKMVSRNLSSSAAFNPSLSVVRNHSFGTSPTYMAQGVGGGRGGKGGKGIQMSPLPPALNDPSASPLPSPLAPNSSDFSYLSLLGEEGGKEKGKEEGEEGGEEFFKVPKPLSTSMGPAGGDIEPLYNKRKRVLRNARTASRNTPPSDLNGSLGPPANPLACSSPTRRRGSVSPKRRESPLGPGGGMLVSSGPFCGMPFSPEKEVSPKSPFIKSKESPYFAPRGSVLSVHRKSSAPEDDIVMPISEQTALRRSPKPKRRSGGLLAEYLENTKDSDYLDDYPPSSKLDEYTFLRKTDKNCSGNPKKHHLLKSATQLALKDAGIDGKDAEKDLGKWNVLHNALRFLKIDEGLKFSRRPSKMKEFDDLDEADLLEGPPPRQLKVLEELGEGGMGRVFKAKNGGDTMVVKKMAINSNSQKQVALNEIFYLNELKSPFVVDFYEAFSTRDEIWLTMDYLEGHPLSDHKKRKNERDITYCCFKVLEALNYLHSNNIVHRDLKSENIMMTSTGEIKLIDLGMAASTEEGELVQMCGSPFWLSPEMVRMAPHSYPTDIWSFGICAIEWMNGHPPYDENPLGYVYYIGTLPLNGISMDLPLNDHSKWSPELIGFLKHCLQPNPTHRATAEGLLKHPFLKDVMSKEEFLELC